MCQQKNIKIGHAGTLDPLATGILLLCIGKQTKNISQIQLGEKTYAGSLAFGRYSPSYDLEKRTIEKQYDAPKQTEIVKAFKSLEGEYEQTAPMFSAKKFKGKRAFELAREGKEVELKKNLVNIKTYQILAQRGNCIDFEMHCSKGTYVRSAVRDVGLALKTEAVMTALRRTKSGDYLIENALQKKSWEQALISELIANENLDK